LDLVSATGSNGRVALIEVLAGFRVEQPLERPVWKTSKRPVVAGYCHHKEPLNSLRRRPVATMKCLVYTFALPKPGKFILVDSGKAAFWDVQA
jgi:hypothetical protein